MTGGGVGDQKDFEERNIYLRSVSVFFLRLTLMHDAFIETFERTVFILFKYLLQLMLYILVDGDLLNSAMLI